MKSAGQDGPLLYRGPCAAVSRGRQAAQREPTGCRFLFARAGDGMARAWTPELRQRRSSCPMPELRQRRSSCPMPVRKARPRLTDLPCRRRHGEGMDARVEATQEQLPDARVEATQEQLPEPGKRQAGWPSLLLRASCPSPFGPASPFAPQAHESPCSKAGTSAHLCAIPIRAGDTADEAQAYSFLMACPPNSLRIDASNLSVNESSSRERKRSISDSVITGAGTLSSIAASTVQRPSPESTT